MSRVRSHTWTFGRNLAAGIVALSVLAPVTSAAKRDKAASPETVARILTQPLDYHPTNSYYLAYRTSSSSLDFIDSDHLLFTFRVTGLLKRLPECKPDDDDQVIRALIIHLPDGNVVKSAEWRMHDRERYLWPLGKGRFLVRQRDLLLTTDSTLELQPYIQSTSPIRLVRLSPDARLLLIETDLEKHTEEEHRKLNEDAGAQGSPAPREDVQIAVIDPQDRSLIARSKALNPVDLAVISDGSLEALPGKGNHWVIRYVPFHGDPSILADVESSCYPSEIPVSRDHTLVLTCATGGDRPVFAVSLSGKTLWSRAWDSHSIWPAIATSENGSRVAYSTMQMRHAVNAFRPIDEDASEFEAQRVEVFDLETGKLQLTQFASPILSGGQNFTLSADGRRFAILREGAVEVYELPPAANSGSGARE